MIYFLQIKRENHSFLKKVIWAGTEEAYKLTIGNLFKSSAIYLESSDCSSGWKFRRNLTLANFLSFMLVATPSLHLCTQQIVKK